VWRGQSFASSQLPCLPGVSPAFLCLLFLFSSGPILHLFIHSLLFLLTSPTSSHFPLLFTWLLHTHIHHLLISLLHQSYTLLSLCNPWHKKPPLQHLNYILTHIRALYPQPPHVFPPHPFTPFAPLLPSPFQITWVFISIQTTIAHPQFPLLIDIITKGFSI
jgi:hypothetical protein